MVEIKPPSVEELRALGFSHPEMPRITCEQFKLMIDEGRVSADDFIMVDVRVEGFVNQHIIGSIFIPVQYSSGAPILTKTVMRSLRSLPKDRLIIFYDSGEKDTVATSMAQVLLDLNEGYDPGNIKVLWQGFNRWRELNYPFYDPEEHLLSEDQFDM